MTVETGMSLTVDETVTSNFARRPPMTNQRKSYINVSK